ncbi:MAG: hypothetical protein HUU47_11245, partial [Bacteroidetes bacterium]|nr:hypothetical protein [Bacteroidota bacterium]
MERLVSFGIDNLLRNSIKIYLLLFFALNTSAQNLLFNGSFEEYIKQPESVQYSFYNRKLYYSKGWDACCSNKNDSCGSTDYYYYPNYYESKSWKQPKQPFEGNYLIGLFAYSFRPKDFLNPGPFYREYASGLLSTPLVVGKKYKLSLAHTNGQFFGEQKAFAHNGFGVLLSTYYPMQKDDFSRLNIIPQFRTPYLLSDSIWKIMQFEFVADSAYRYITMGNFYLSSDIEMIVYKNIGESYLFIDDVKIEPITDKPKLPNPFTLCKPDSVFIENKE